VDGQRLGEARRDAARGRHHQIADDLVVHATTKSQPGHECRSHQAEHRRVVAIRVRQVELVHDLGEAGRRQRGGVPGQREVLVAP